MDDDEDKQTSVGFGILAVKVPEGKLETKQHKIWLKLPKRHKRGVRSAIQLRVEVRPFRSDVQPNSCVSGQGETEV